MVEGGNMLLSALEGSHGMEIVRIGRKDDLRVSLSKVDARVWL